MLNISKGKVFSLICLRFCLPPVFRGLYRALFCGGVDGTMIRKAAGAKVPEIAHSTILDRWTGGNRMRTMAAVILCLAISVPPILGSYGYGDRAGDSKISFSVPFLCRTDRGDRTRCLADAFKPGLSAVLVSKKGVCVARTAETSTQAHHVEDFHATRLSGPEGCFPVEDDESSFSKFCIAVVGTDPAAIRVVSPKDDKSPVAKEIESKARKLAVPHIQEPQRLYDMSRVPVTDAKPKVLRTEKVTLLIFEIQAEGEPWAPGPTVALTNAGVFLLEGACTYGDPTFFSVNDKLYVTYNATVACCGCGDTNFFVYDLSRPTPKKVYHDTTFSY